MPARASLALPTHIIMMLRHHQLGAIILNSGAAKAKFDGSTLYAVDSNRRTKCIASTNVEFHGGSAQKAHQAVSYY